MRWHTPAPGDMQGQLASGVYSLIGEVGEKEHRCKRGTLVAVLFRSLRMFFRYKFRSGTLIKSRTAL